MKVLELFAGSRCIGREAEKHAHDVFSVDWGEFPDIDLRADIGELQACDLPFTPDYIWASPDCTTYSIAACSTHRNRDRTAKSEYAKKCDEVNSHVISLVKSLIEINRELVFFIENPRGLMRHMPFMKGINRETVWYCQYGDTRAKPTDIWTNSKDWKPRAMCRNFKYNKDTGEIVDRHCHHQSARRGAKTGTQGLKSAYERSFIPAELCGDIVKTFG